AAVETDCDADAETAAPAAIDPLVLRPRTDHVTRVSWVDRERGFGLDATVAERAGSGDLHERPEGQPAGQVAAFEKLQLQSPVEQPMGGTPGVPRSLL